MDWGYYYPFSIHWWGVAQEDFQHPHMQDITIPLGSPVCYREWYGSKKGVHDRGMGFPPEYVARQILKIEGTNEGTVDYRVADPKIWTTDTGVSTGHIFQKEGVIWKRGENNHETGWMETKIRINGDEQGRPEIYWFDTCTHSDRCFKHAVRDEKNPSEIDKACEIHACDDARYMVMLIKRGLRASDRREKIPEVLEQNRLTFGDVLGHAEEYLNDLESTSGGELEP